MYYIARLFVAIEPDFDECFTLLAIRPTILTTYVMFHTFGQSVRNDFLRGVLWGESKSEIRLAKSGQGWPMPAKQGR